MTNRFDPHSSGHSGRRSRLFRAAALSAAVLAGLWGAGASNAGASDHIDSPQLAHDHASDLNDTYAFLDPNDNTRLVN